MKKSLAMILVLVLLISVVGVAPAFAADGNDDVLPVLPFMKEDVTVVAVFAGVKAQPIKGPDDAPEGAEPVKADTIWIFYTDETYDQYAETSLGYERYSTGTYFFKEDADFVIVEGEDNGIIVIERNQTYSMEKKMLEDDKSTEEYELGTLGYVQLFGPDDGRAVEAIYGDPTMTLYEDENGVLKKLDTVWIFFSDGSFSDYVFLEGDVILNCKGSYEFDEAGDFHLPPYEEDSGTITLTFEESLAGREGQSKTIDLGAMGLTCLYEKYNEAFQRPEWPTTAG